MGRDVSEGCVVQDSLASSFFSFHYTPAHTGVAKNCRLQRLSAKRAHKGIVCNYYVDYLPEDALESYSNNGELL